MTISANYIGPSTVQVTVTFNTGDNVATFTPFDTFQKCVKDAILGTQPSTAGAASGVSFTSSNGVTAQSTSGWSLLEESWGGLTASNWGSTASVTYTQIFTALNNDGKSTKTLILRYKTDTQEVYVSTCEKWDTVTHTPSNEAYSFIDCCPINYNLTSCDFIINVCPRWAFFHSYICNESTRWAAVVEAEREAFEDTCANGYPYSSAVGNPNWGVINSVIPTLGINTTASIADGAFNKTSQLLWVVPRTKTGVTGVNACIKWGSDHGITQYPNFAQGLGVSPLVVRMGNTDNKLPSSAWDNSKRVILPIKPIYDYVSGPLNYGMLHGLKLLAPVGNNMNKVQLQVDSNGNASNTGNLRDHWVVNLTGIPLNKSFKGYSNSTTTIKRDTLGTNEDCGVPKKFLSVGNKTYILSDRGLSRYDISSKVETKIYPTGLTTDATLIDMAFDGERYLYITSSTNTAALRRLDTLDDTTISTYTTVISTGLAGVAINGDTVIACQNTATTPNLYRFTKQASTGTVTALAAKTGSAGTVTAPTVVASPAAILYSTGIDSEGNFYFGSKASNLTMGKLAYNGTTAITAANMFGNPTYTYTAGRVSYGVIGLDYFGQIRQSTGSGLTATITVNKCSTNTTLYNAYFANYTNIALAESGTMAATNTNDLIYVNGRLQTISCNSAASYSSVYYADVIACIANCEITSATVQSCVLDSNAYPTQAIISPSVATSADANIAAMYYDGARLYVCGAAFTATTGNFRGYKVLDNINGGRILGGVFGDLTTLAQFAIPA